MCRFAILALSWHWFFFIVLMEDYCRTPIDLDYIPAIVEGDERTTAYQLTCGMDGSGGMKCAHRTTRVL